MDWRRTLHNGVLMVVLATALIWWGVNVLGWVSALSPMYAWYKLMGRLSFFLPDLIAYFIIGATVGTPTGLLFPRHPIRVALLLILVWETFSLYYISIQPNMLRLTFWSMLVPEAAEILVFLPLFAYLGAKLRRRWLASPSQLTSNAT